MAHRIINIPINTPNTNRIIKIVNKPPLQPNIVNSNVLNTAFVIQSSSSNTISPINFYNKRQVPVIII